jgi:hypothetical protein
MNELETANSWDVQVCTISGSTHDWRPYRYQRWGADRTSWRCVWCHAVACGNYGELDPCWLPYHHRGDHRSRSGVAWPLGGDRPDPLPRPR